MSEKIHLKLLGSVALGDKVAFEKLYQITSGKLMAVSLQLLQKKDLAEDAMQDAYVSIWHNASEYRSERGSVLTWMISIVRYRALDIIRSRKIRHEDKSINNDMSTDLEGSEKLPEIKLFLHRDKIRLDGCLNELNPPQADVISLAYFRGFTHKEVCHYLAKPLGSVKSWIRRGLQSLKRCLEP